MQVIDVCLLGTYTLIIAYVNLDLSTRGRLRPGLPENPGLDSLAIRDTYRGRPLNLSNRRRTSQFRLQIFDELCVSRYNIHTVYNFHLINFLVARLTYIVYYIMQYILYSS